MSFAGKWLERVHRIAECSRPSTRHSILRWAPLRQTQVLPSTWRLEEYKYPGNWRISRYEYILWNKGVSNTWNRTVSYLSYWTSCILLEKSAGTFAPVQSEPQAPSCSAECFPGVWCKGDFYGELHKVSFWSRTARIVERAENGAFSCDNARRSVSEERGDARRLYCCTRLRFQQRHRLSGAFAVVPNHRLPSNALRTSGRRSQQNGKYAYHLLPYGRR